MQKYRQANLGMIFFAFSVKLSQQVYVHVERAVPKPSFSRKLRNQSAASRYPPKYSALNHFGFILLLKSSSFNLCRQGVEIAKNAIYGLMGKKANKFYAKKFYPEILLAI